MANKATDFAKIATAAHIAGVAAAESHVPTPMTLAGGMPGEVPTIYHVPEGMCGFAWVTVRPGNCAFANYAKKNLGCRKAYGGGVQLWISDYGQSIERKEAYAQAYAEVLKGAGVNACSGSRLD